MKYAIWALMLLAQSASFTWVSRARNSGNLGYHAVAAVFSHLTWFVGQFVLIDEIVRTIHAADWPHAAALAIFYVVFMVAGAVGMHWVSLRYLETGSRKVGG